MKTPRVKYLKDYRPPTYLVDHADLYFDLNETETIVRAVLKMRRNDESGEENAPLILDGEKMELLSVHMDDRPLDPAEYRVTENTLEVFNAPETFTLATKTRIKPQENTSLDGLYRSQEMFCTQCESHGFRKITYYPDRPDVMAKFTCTIEADRKRYPVLLSNGNPTARGMTGEDRHWVKWEDPFRKPSYLFALVAGDLVRLADSYTTVSGRAVSLEIYVEAANADKCDHAMASLKKAMAWDEEKYGREYDLDIYMIVAVNDFNAGAMENKGLNIFNSIYVLARPETATDSDFLAIEAVIAHEYFHNWTGNRVTLKNWFQLSLKEGLTVFRDQCFTADMTSPSVKRITDVTKLRINQFPEDAGPMAHPVRPESYIEMNNFYTMTVYEKGAEVIRMIHTILGEEGFRRGMDLYFERFDGMAVTTEDFVRTMEDANDADLSRFSRWYAVAGTPAVTMTCSHDPREKSFTLTFTQECPPTPGQEEKPPLHIPVSAALLSPSGSPLPLRLQGEDAPGGTSRMLHLLEKETTFRFMDVPEKPVPSVLRNFSAPVKLSAGYTPEELLFLFANDPDPFNRWDSGQTLFADTINGLVANLARTEPLTLDDAFIRGFGKTLINSSLDKTFIARALTLPSEIEMGDMSAAPVDVDGIHHAREFILKRVGSELHDQFLGIYRDNHDTGPVSRDSDAVSRRALKNLALFYLGKSGAPGSEELIFSAFESANNMTDELAAFTILAGMENDMRERAVAMFHEKWKENVLVLDKWFATQAAARLEGTLSTVKNLMNHPAFSIRNPNKIRALIGTFCASNPWCFHDAGGEGYRFLGDRVITLNALNPQIAARLTGQFNRWKRYDENRRTLMKAELTRILEQPDLSPNVFEIASKALA